MRIIYEIFLILKVKVENFKICDKFSVVLFSISRVTILPNHYKTIQRV